MDDGEQPPSRIRHYSAALRQAGTLVVVFASFESLFLKSAHDIRWLDLGVWVLAGIALLLFGTRLD